MDAASLRPLGVGETLDVAIKLYRHRFTTLVKAVAVIIGPVYVFFAIVQLSLLPTPGDLQSFDDVDPVTGLPQTDFGDVWAFFAATLLLGVAGYIATQLATAAAFRIIGATYLGEEVDWRESLRFARTRLWPLLGLSILLAIVVGLGFLLCIIPGIYLYGAYSVVVPVLLVENVRGTRALKRSKSLVEGRWWQVAVVIFLGFFMASIVSNVLSGVVSVGLGASGSDVTAVIGNTIASVVAAAIVTPFTAAVTMVVYFDLRVRKEGFDVELLARDVGVAPPTGGRPNFLPPPPPPPPSEGTEPPFWPPPPGWRRPDG